MNNKRELISTSQFMLSVGCFMQGSTLLTFGVYRFVKQEAWISVMIGLVISLPVLWMYVFLAKHFPGKSLVEINRIVLGKIFGGIFSALYAYYFISLVFLNTRLVGDFVNGFVLPVTPMSVVLFMFVFVCCWAVRKGVKTMTRYAMLLVVASFALLILSFVLLMNNIKWDNFQPVFSLPLINYFEGAHIIAMLPVCEIMAFFMLIPNLKNPGDFGKTIWGGLAIGAVTLLFVIIRTTAVLGEISAMIPYPTFSVVRLINIENILTRMEVLYAVLLIILAFYKVTILLYAGVSGISRLLGFSSYKFLVATCGAIVVIMALVVFDSAMEHAYWMTSGSAPIYSTFFLLAMPLITFVVAAVRGLLSMKRVGNT